MMKKKVVSVLLVLAMCVSLGTQTFALAAVEVPPENKQFVIGKRRDAVVDNSFASPSTGATSRSKHLMNLFFEGMETNYENNTYFSARICCMPTDDLHSICKR